MIAIIAAAIAFQPDNVLTPKEAKAGFKLLFDGKTTNGWHNFKAKGVRSGWTITDGVLASTDPANAGDIVSEEKFDWFELYVDYNVSKGGNSGIMFRVADDGDATWHSGPEIQIMDRDVDPKGQLAGYLYQIYPSHDEAVKPPDATKPPGEWNRLHIIVSPKKCETFMNGVKYYEYVYGSADFWDRVKKSKFSEFPGFGKLDKGSIAIQGDHGLVSFKNIKIRPIKATRR
ncbi:MAG: DUF1080 domain-containing protein [Armatimonadota bacterium]